MKDHHKSHRTARQEDVRASVDRLLDPYQKTERFHIVRKCVSSILQAPHRKGLEEDVLQCQRKATEANERTAELYSEQGNTAAAELVVNDETTQCEIISGRDKIVET